MKSSIFKVDFEKAFDNLNWDFLLEMMERMDFGIRWRKWILACLKSASISILVNGSPTDEYCLECGVRQGDPLSPFLFIIAVEGLNNLKKSAINSGLYKGVEIGVVNDEVEFMANRFGCKVGEMPFMYLGLPMGRNMKKADSWKPVIEKFNSRLSE
ncbi:secreted RxLR effector protein 78-like [Rutidosis leptorrhynchoides]|uniref:secreted RxLR effector protein 78-like n=1 Tax=Rutidosis leptorrhynchoides TaxID=125765 RepID=UPI003A99DD9C